MIPAEGPARVISRVVAEAFGIPAEALASPARLRRVAAARHVAIGILAAQNPGGAESPWSTTAIGRRFGGRDHSTVFHSIQRYRGYCAALGLEPIADDPAARARAIASRLGFSEADPRLVFRNPKEASVPSMIPAQAAPDFGSFRLAAGEFNGLSPALQREAALIALEFGAAEKRAAKILGVTPGAIGAALRRNPPPHHMPGQEPFIEGGRQRSDIDTDCAPETVAPRPEPTGGPQADAGFRAFAASWLARGGDLDVAAAYTAYSVFSRARLGSPLPRSSFGAALRALATENGGSRRGDRIEGLCLRAPQGGQGVPA